MKKLLFLFILITNNIVAQEDTVKYNKSFNNSITGVINQTDSKSLTNITYSGNNTLNLNNLEIGSSTNYIVGFSNKLEKNELTQRLNMHKTNKSIYTFVTHVYNYSLLRQITDNNMIGAGIGYKNKLTNSKISTSWGLIYGRTLFLNGTKNYNLRHSLRLKYQYKGEILNFLTEYYYQPTINLKDVLANGSIKLSFKVKNGFLFIVEDVLNYSNMSNIKTIHNITLGVSYDFSKSGFYLIRK